MDGGIGVDERFVSLANLALVDDDLGGVLLVWEKLREEK